MPNFRATTFTLGTVLAEGSRVDAERAARRFVEAGNIARFPLRTDYLPDRTVFGIEFGWLSAVPRFVPQAVVVEVRPEDSKLFAGTEIIC